MDGRHHGQGGDWAAACVLYQGVVQCAVLDASTLLYGIGRCHYVDITL